MKPIRIYAKANHEAEARRIAAALQRGESLDTVVVVDLAPDRFEDLVVLARGKASTAGSGWLPCERSGMAGAFLVGDGDAYLGTTLFEPTPVTANAGAVQFAPFEVNPDGDPGRLTPGTIGKAADPYDRFADWIHRKVVVQGPDRIEELLVEPRFSLWDGWLAVLICAAILGARFIALVPIVAVWAIGRKWGERRRERRYDRAEFDL